MFSSSQTRQQGKVLLSLSLCCMVVQYGGAVGREGRVNCLCCMVGVQGGKD